MSDFNSLQLRERAVRILTMRNHSESELRQKLTLSVQRSAYSCGKSVAGEEIAIPPDEMDRVIAWCYEYNWLDDSRFAKAFISGRIQKGYGPQHIRQALIHKGVSRTIIDIELDAIHTDWAAQARVAGERKFGSPLPTDWKERARVQRYLLSRGFFMEDIQSIYRNYEPD